MQALKIINQDFGLLLDTKNPLRRTPKQIIRPIISDESDPSSKLDCITREWTEEDLVYWKDYHISLRTLERYNVHPVESIISRGEIKPLGSEIAYVFSEYAPYLKILRPFADKRSKWRSTYGRELRHGGTVFKEELEKYPMERKPFTIVTKSLKDVMVLYEMGFLAEAVSSESVIPELCDYYNIVLLDSDNPGRDAAAKWIEKGHTHSKYIFIEDEFTEDEVPIKDIADLVKYKGFEYAKEKINSLIDERVS